MSDTEVATLISNEAVDTGDSGLVVLNGGILAGRPLFPDLFHEGTQRIRYPEAIQHQNDFAFASDRNGGHTAWTVLLQENRCFGLGNLIQKRKRRFAKAAHDIRAFTRQDRVDDFVVECHVESFGAITDVADGFEQDRMLNYTRKRTDNPDGGI